MSIKLIVHSCIIVIIILYMHSQPTADILVTITSSGGINNTALAGDGYSLVCSVTVSGSTDRPTITWLRPINSSGVVNVTGNVNTLMFSSLVSSDAGTYTCRATLGNAVQTADINIMTSESSVINCINFAVILCVSNLNTRIKIYFHYSSPPSSH